MHGIPIYQHIAEIEDDCINGHSVLLIIKYKKSQEARTKIQEPRSKNQDPNKHRTKKLKACYENASSFIDSITLSNYQITTSSFISFYHLKISPRGRHQTYRCSPSCCQTQLQFSTAIHNDL